MDLAYLLLADRAEVHNDKLYTMGAGWTGLHFAQFPARFSFFIALGVDIPWEETERGEHEFHLRIEDPDGRELVEATGTFSINRPEEIMITSTPRLPLVIPMIVEFTVPGPHVVIIKINNKILGRTRFYVHRTEARDT